MIRQADATSTKISLLSQRVASSLFVLLIWCVFCAAPGRSDAQETATPASISPDSQAPLTQPSNPVASEVTDADENDLPKSGTVDLPNLETPTDLDGVSPDTPESSDVAPSALNSPRPRMNLLDLLLKGGWLMLPLAFMAVFLVMLVIERLFALRRRNVIPKQFVDALGELAAVPGAMDPRRAYQLCQKYPSPAATVILTMLLKIGRPQSEIEHAVSESCEREADRLYANVRWLNLMAAIAPLIGLFGTVWGMIGAFYDTTQMATGQNKAEYLAEGIYVALVTTLGGLAVAIPAAIFAHYFEGRITHLFHEIDELLFALLPQVERFEGQKRATAQSLSATASHPHHDLSMVSTRPSGTSDPPDEANQG